MSVNLSPVAGAGAQFFTDSGAPLTGGLLYTYAAGTTTPRTTYTDNIGATANSNPIVLDSAGRVPYEIWLLFGLNYKFVLKTSAGATIGTWDNISGVNGSPTATSFYADAFTTTAGQTLFTLSANPGSINNLDVSLDGSTLVAGDDFSWSGISITLTMPAFAGQRLRVAYSTVDGVQAISPGSVIDNSVATGTKLYNRINDIVDVKDFGAKGDGVTDDTTAFQLAARAVNGVSGAGAVPGGTVHVSAGTYRVSKIGIRGTRFVGENRENTIIKGIGTGVASDFMFDAQLDMDGTTTNTVGGGWCENMTIDANGSGRSLLRTYGGGARPTSLILKNAIASGAIGLSMGLPIWATISNVYATNCDVGIKTLSGAGDNGTSTTFIDCWANTCLTYGFHITQLYYSSFINCVAQACGTRNWNIDGNSNGITTVYSLQFIGCATEGAGVPFYFRNVRDLTLISPRVISPTSGVDLVTLDNCAGSVIDYSTAGALSGGAYHIKIVNNAAGTGAVKIIGGAPTYNPADTSTTDAIAPMGMSYGRMVNSQAVSYTLVLSDAGKQILHASGAGAGHTFTIPANSAVAYPVGTELAFVNRDGNSVSIAITTDTMLLATTFTTGTRTLATQSMAIARKVSSTVWIIGAEGGGLT